MAVGLEQATQTVLDVLGIAAHNDYASTDNTTIVEIVMELLHIRSRRARHLHHERGTA